MRVYFGFSLISLLVTTALYNAETFTSSNNESSNFNYNYLSPSNELQNPPDTLPFPIPPDNPLNFFPPTHSPLHLSNPPNINDTIVYDPETNEYIYYQKIGNMFVRTPRRLSFEEFYEKDFDRILNAYWLERNRSKSPMAQDGIIPSIHVGGKVFEGIFGSNTIDIRPQGSAELIFGVTSSRREDNTLNVRQQRNTNFNFEQNIQMNVMAKVGEKINFGVKYNTELTFDFENEYKLEYVGGEDEIIKKIEAGNVTLPLNSTLITGSQSLFGIKADMQFGKTKVTSVISHQKGESSTITVTGGAQLNEFMISALDYEANRHFFISQYFRDNYNRALSSLPIINSPINITKIEVWVTNIGPATTENRNIVAFMDLGEHNPFNQNLSPVSNLIFPSNNTNDIHTFIPTDDIRNLNNVNNAITNAGIGMTSGIDFEKVENARKLNPNEYTFNSKLGFISLNSRLNPDQVLAVAFQYTVIGIDEPFQVGEFSNEGINSPSCLSVKLLKSTATNTKIPLWDLMMKNVYSIGGFQINPEDFQFHVTYKASEIGIPMGFLTETNIQGIPLIRVFNMDNLNRQMDPEPDGIFDFIDQAAANGGTIQSSNGRVFFPVTEPFGSFLREKITNPTLAEKYAFDSLYTMTQHEARQYPNKNRFLIQGSFKSSVSSEISLNAANVPQGSVRVTAGGIPLQENVDFTVDYTLGRVRIINEGILNSGTPLHISLESKSLMGGFRTKSLVGTTFEHQLRQNMTIGGSILNLSEKPLTTKVNFGDEPISNTIWGLNYTFQNDVPLITKLLDKLPFYSTKAPSKVNFNAEFAHFIPGQARGIRGTSYIDDFEASRTSTDIKNINRWFLASVPQGQINLFPEAKNDSTIAYGFNRALLSWYIIDPLFYRNNNTTPQHIRNDLDQLSNHYVREVLEREIFPNKQSPNQLQLNIPILNLSFFPSERGPYNFDTSPSTFSSGIDNTGKLLNPSTRWAGIMRNIDFPDFEETNVEYIEFWMLDPFIYNENHSGGYLVFNLGDISEDVLHDNKKSFENGLPAGILIENVDTTQWGRVPTIQSIVNAFDNNPVSRQYQDVGIDGLSNDDERTFFEDSFLNQIAALHGTSSIAFQLASSDPAGDNYRYFRGSEFDNQQASIMERYKFYNGVDGNSPTAEQSTEAFPTSSTILPTVEDINRDNTLSSNERYYQYVIKLTPESMKIGENYITDFIDASPRLRNGNVETVRWFQFKIPVKSPDQVIGNIEGFKSIRFMRLFLRGFEEEVTLRFATLELVRSQWRRYEYNLLSPGEYIPNDEHNNTSFEVSSVNIEENGNRTPIPYVLPPGIERERLYGATAIQQLNEQSLSLKVCNLIDGDARAVYKTTDFDLRRYKRLKMFVHAEEKNPDEFTLKDGDLTLFIRIGTDFTENYYEYEIPLKPVPWDVGFNREKIWPLDQQLDLELQKFIDLKLKRNNLLRESNSNVTLSSKFYEIDGNNRISIVGAPNLGDVKVIMVGVRNPKKFTLTDVDDGMPKCAEIWVNELRLTDFDDKGGWAATARLQANLADLGNLTLAGFHSTAGFGTLDKKLNELEMYNVSSYDFATSLELGKLLPEKAGIKIPLHFDISESFSNPKYNPLNPDVLLKEELRHTEDETLRDSIVDIVQDYTRRRSFNLMNVSKARTGDRAARIRLWDIENFDFSYAFKELYNSSIDIEYNVRRENKIGLGYTFQNNPKNYKPLQNIEFLKNRKSLALLTDFNFYLSPRSITFRSDIFRDYQEQLMRNKTDAVILLEPNFMKVFNWNRMYNFNHDFTQSLKFTFSANTIARIDEPPGRINRDDDDYIVKRDSIINNLMNFGRITQYNQNYTISYQVPINKIPLFNWINLNTQYSGDYKWTGAPLFKDTTGAFVDHPFGNTIENNRNLSANLTGNLNQLYNKVKYLRTLNQPQRPQSRDTIPRIDKDGNPIEQIKEKINYPKLVLDHTLRFMMMLKNVSASFSRSEGMLIPGFKTSPTILGNDLNNNAPGMGFIFGSQRDIRETLARQSLLSTDTMLNLPFAQKYNENLNLRATLEPFRTFRIELTATRTYSLNYQEFYRFNNITNEFNSFTPSANGNFSISIVTLNTAFIRDEKDFSNANFIKFKEIRPQVARAIAQNNPNWSGNFIADPLDNNRMYPEGYSSTSQDVLIAAFKAAYTGNDFNKFTNQLFQAIPLPNWRVNYTGLANIEFLKKYFKRINLMHAYRSTYNIGGFNNNVNFQDPDNDGFTWVRDLTGNYLPVYEVGQVGITEQFSPLINLDLEWHFGMTSRFEIKKSRNLALAIANHQMTEISSNELVIGVGYIIKDVPLAISSGTGTRTFRSDINIKADLSIRDNRTILRRITENYDLISAGQRIVSINTSADYKLSSRFIVRVFFDRIINTPHISAQFKNSNTNAGVSLRFSLAQ